MNFAKDCAFLSVKWSLSRRVGLLPKLRNAEIRMRISNREAKAAGWATNHIHRIPWSRRQYWALLSPHPVLKFKMKIEG